MPRYHNPTGGPGDVGAHARRNESSALIDIRTLSSFVDAQQRAQPVATASSVAMPTFAAPWARSGLDVPSQPASREVAAVRPVARPAPVDNRPLYVMIAGLSLAVASLGAYVVLRPPPASGPVAAAAPLVAASEVAAHDDAHDDAHEQEAEKDDASSEAAQASDPARAEAEAQADEAGAAEAEAQAQAQSQAAAEPTRPSKHRPHGRTSAPTKKPPVVKPTKDTKSAVPVECVIDPSKCDARGTPTPGPEQDTKGLPKSPSSSAIRSAMSKVKPAAKACGPKHGGKPGTTVRVKLSVAGKTGSVIDARALEDHAGTALGRCVASAMSKATMPRFAKEQAGVVYAIRL